MTGSSFGTLFRLSTFGESHGAAIGGVIDGVPPGLLLSEGDIQPFLDERAPGGRGVTPRLEADEVRLLSGLFEGRTTGTPIGFLIENTQARSQDYEALKHQFRPGHADFTYQQKYGLRDPRGGGRSSARETAARVVGGAVARLWLQARFGVEIRGALSKVGTLAFSPDFESAKRYRRESLFCPQPDRLLALLDETREKQDSLGAQVVVYASGVPSGWGEPVFDRLDARLAYALMSIPAVKAVSVGEGFSAVEAHGSEFRDALGPQGFLSNHAGGVLGGISSGATLTAYANFKPTSSIAQPVETLDAQGKMTSLSVRGRHDPCVGIRGVPVAEAMVALSLADFALQQVAREARA